MRYVTRCDSAKVCERGHRPLPKLERYCAPDFFVQNEDAEVFREPQSVVPFQ